MMEDFNAMNSSIEAGLTTAVGRADSAVATANTAHDIAGTNYGPDNKPYAVGSYTGDGAAEREIAVGFQPSFLIICSSQLTHALTYVGLGVTVAGPNVTSRRVFLTGTGFRLDSNDTVNNYPEVNTSGTVYNYIAFR